MLCVLPMKRGQWEVAGVRLADPPSSSKLLFAFTTPLSLVNSMARIHVRLLGPCFKTGRRGRRPTPQRDVNRNRALLAIRVHSSTCLVRSQEQGAAGITDNFTRALRSRPNSSCGKPRGKCTRDNNRTSRRVIADQERRG